MQRARRHAWHTRILCEPGVFREQIFEGILPFWIQHSIDTELGGYITHLRRDGSRYDTIKTTAMQSRMMYAFAAAYRLSGERNYLELARHGLQFMTDGLWDSAYGGWPDSTNRHGAPLDAEKRTFTESYAIIGLAEYYAATKDTSALELAQRTFELAKHFLHDKECGGYFLRCAPDWSLLSTRKTICSQLDMLFALVSLYRPTGDHRYVRDAVELAHVILEHMYDRRFHCLVETCNANWTYDPFATRDITWIGHNLKGAWVLLQLFEITGVERFAEAARGILDFSIRCGYDCENGGFFHYVYRSGPLASQEKLWWTNCEALMALLLAARLDDAAGTYAPYFNGTLDFCMRSFLDPKYGEWYRSCDAAGMPLNSSKGGGDKAAYHTVQACAYAIEYLQALQQRGHACA